MKISYKKVDSSNSTPYAVKKKAVYKFKIESSILKTHYKELARMAFLFNSEERNTGYILSPNKDNFLALVEKAEKVNEKVASNSHAKSVEKAKSRRANISNSCNHDDLGSLGYTHGSNVRCPHCGEVAEVW